MRFLVPSCLLLHYSAAYLLENRRFHIEQDFYASLRTREGWVHRSVLLPAPSFHHGNWESRKRPPSWNRGQPTPRLTVYPTLNNFESARLATALLQIFDTLRSFSPYRYACLSTSRNYCASSRAAPGRLHATTARLGRLTREKFRPSFLANHSVCHLHIPRTSTWSTLGHATHVKKDGGHVVLGVGLVIICVRRG
ncbi:hypothetical protein SCHPADRAFT_165237 [Schizopora paradoxa]|uniref:Secreted protein n=1 Tax=Schizopora paradoxa TaxID=27342 RepID=A0A0H2SKC1_9AGAM|nr:hypothetical protein SCHPADRAFT_165237 [Schizopora paradoxa]